MWGPDRIRTCIHDSVKGLSPGWPPPTPLRRMGIGLSRRLSPNQADEKRTEPLEPKVRFELTTTSLPWMHSATELLGLVPSLFHDGSRGGDSGQSGFALLSSAGICSTRQQVAPCIHIETFDRIG